MWWRHYPTPSYTHTQPASPARNIPKSPIALSLVAWSRACTWYGDSRCPVCLSVLFLSNPLRCCSCFPLSSPPPPLFPFLYHYHHHLLPPVPFSPSCSSCFMFAVRASFSVGQGFPVPGFVNIRTDICWVFLERGMGHRKPSSYTGQHAFIKYACPNGIRAQMCQVQAVENSARHGSHGDNGRLYRRWKSQCWDFRLMSWHSIKSSQSFRKL